MLVFVSWWAALQRLGSGLNADAFMGGSLVGSVMGGSSDGGSPGGCRSGCSRRSGSSTGGCSPSLSGGFFTASGFGPLTVICYTKRGRACAVWTAGPGRTSNRAKQSWTLSDRDLLWASFSRAVRTPARFDRDLVNPGVFAGGPDFDSEKLVAYEVGYRGQPTTATSVSVSAFYNVYDELRTI